MGCCLAALMLPATAAAESTPARRIISLDYCADQYVLALADRERILALSPDATSEFSYLADAAVGIPTIRPRAEEILLQQPDLVVRSYGGGAAISGMLERLDIPVVDVGFSMTLGDIPERLQEVAEGLGESARAQQLIEQFNARLDRQATLLADADTRSEGSTPSALYMTPGGVTAGEGTLIHEMLAAAGLQNFSDQPGWRELPLERLAGEAPDLIAAAVFRSRDTNRTHWSAMRHAIAQRQLAQRPAVALDGAWTSCGGWFLMDAVEALAAGAFPTMSPP